MIDIRFLPKHLIFVSAFLVLAAMNALGRQADMLEIGNARIFYETAGKGLPIVFIHAGVADSRQWNNEFRSFSKNHTVVRYDMRGFGKSEPVDGEFSHLDDLSLLLEHLNLDEPPILVGCSMGGGTALDYALREPDKVRALALVGSAPSGLQVDLPTPPKFRLVEEAEKAGDLELIAELETQIWFDGDRPTEKVDRKMRQLAYDMNLIALQNHVKDLGTRLPNSKMPAVGRLSELQMPVLAIIGEKDIPYMHAAGDVMGADISDYRRVTIANAAHLPNMDQPAEFEKVLTNFVEAISHKGS
jgi:2-hydroxy-6-oxonona-2,4-dienedioate hydrolase